MPTQKHIKSEVSGSHDGEYEDDRLLGSCGVKSRRNWPTFQSSLLPPSSQRFQICLIKNYFYVKLAVLFIQINYLSHEHCQSVLNGGASDAGHCALSLTKIKNYL
jgi:hypothetical protein